MRKATDRRYGVESEWIEPPIARRSICLACGCMIDGEAGELGALIHEACAANDGIVRVGGGLAGERPASAGDGSPIRESSWAELRYRLLVSGPEITLPPADLGRFDCSGRYIFPTPGKAKP